MRTFVLIIIAVISYLLGSLNGSIIVSRRLFHKDIRRYGSAYMLERPNGRASMGLFRRRREEAGPLCHNNAVSAVSARLKKRPDPAEPFDGAKNVEKIPLLFVIIMPVNQSAIRFGRRAPETFGSMRALSQCVFQVKHGCVSLRRQGLGPAALPPAVGPRIFA